MSLEEHAIRELTMCGQYQEDPEYSESIVRAVREFASYGHSGGSASIAREQLHALLGFKTLSPITSDPEEWLDQSEASGIPMWQNRRDPSFFSTDRGETWYSLDEKRESSHQPLREELSSLLNSQSHENVSNTPDFILASFLTACLSAFDGCVLAREDWYGHRDEPGGIVKPGEDSQLDL